MPVIWIDTHAITKLSNAYSQQQNNTLEFQQNRQLLERLHRLRRAGDVFVFETDQMREIEVKSKISGAAKTILAQLTLGVRGSHLEIEDSQTYRAMRAAIARSEEEELEFSSAFKGDPFQQEQRGAFIIDVKITPDRDAISKKLSENKEIASKWESMRKSSKSSTPYSIRRKRQWDKELLARQNIFRDTYYSLREPENTEDLFRQIDFFSLPMTNWRQLGGEPTPQALYNFYGSSYYTDLPFVEIFSGLAAHKVTGNEVIIPSDIADINHVSTALPYCSHMVLDSAMRNAVREVGFDKKYNVKLLSLKDLDDDIKSFSGH